VRTVFGQLSRTINNPLPSRIRLSGRGAVLISLSRASAKPVSRLPGGVCHDEARIVMLLDDPRRREAARGGYGAMIVREAVGENDETRQSAS
jgi:hypothetical protein